MAIMMTMSKVSAPRSSPVTILTTGLGNTDSEMLFNRSNQDLLKKMKALAEAISIAINSLLEGAK